MERERSPEGAWGDWLRRGRGVEALPEAFQVLPPAVKDEVLYRIRYQGYLEREQRQIAKLSRSEHVRIPYNYDYQQVRGLRNECRQKLEAIRPATLGQAARISGVNPADISLLMVALHARSATS